MEPLFSNLFPNADKTSWLAQVQKELKSGDAYKDLYWQTNEGFALEPYYTADSIRNLPLDVIQAAQKTTVGWLNTPNYYITDEKVANAVLRDALVQGADALILSLPSSSINVAQLLNGIKLSDTPVFFRLASNAIDLIRSLQTVAPYQLKGGLFRDADDVTPDVTHLTINSPQFRTVCITGHAFHNAGANATQELAFTIASLADAYDKLTDNGMTINELVPKTILSLSVGTSYFMEIAKLRALRVLFNRFISSYSSSTSDSQSIRHPFIHCQTSTFYEAAVTPYTNLLRATTEAMAAVMGGCDALTVYPYDTILAKSAKTSDQEFANRIARNVSLLLKEESYLDKVTDPSAGSYYVENLTYQLMEAAWTLFLNVEKRGGLSKAGEFVKSEIERSYQAKVEAVRTGKVLVGVTKFRSDEPSDQTNTILTDNKGLSTERRLAREFE